VTWLGGHPSLSIGPLLESHKHDIGDILRESLEHEAEALDAYHRLLDLVRDKDVRLEEYAREMISAEVAHQDEVDKMLRRPGQTEAFKA
jgi:bacterioferritin